MLAGKAMQSKPINLSEIINIDVTYENEVHRQKILRRQQFFCRRKSHIGRHLRRHSDCRRGFSWLYN